MATAEQIRNREDFQALLMNEEKWPPSFEWDFRYPQTCALGLARKAGVSGGITEYLGLDWHDFVRVFVNHVPDGGGTLVTFYGKSSSEVTPADVAKAIGALA